MGQRARGLVDGDCKGPVYRVLSQYSSEHCIGFLGEDNRVQGNTSDLFTPLYLADMIMEKTLTHPIENITCTHVHNITQASLQYEFTTTSTSKCFTTSVVMHAHWWKCTLYSHMRRHRTGL